MFSHQPVRFYLFVFLAFAVLSSKHILIYNEETLIALSFFCFLFFILYFFGTTIQESLDERSTGILAESQNSSVLKHRLFGDMLQQSRKEKTLVKTVPTLGTFTKNLYPVGRLDGKALVKNTVTTRIHTKLKPIGLSHQQVQEKIQSLYSQQILLPTFMAFHESALTPGVGQKHLIAKMTKSRERVPVSV